MIAHVEIRCAQLVIEIDDFSLSRDKSDACHAT